MQSKIISSLEWSSLILPKSGTSFSTISPVKVINNSPHFAFTWAGVASCVSGPSVPVGTIFASRHGFEEGARIKTDEWLIYGKNNELLVQDVKNKNKIPDHHTNGTPSMFINAPESIKELFKK